MLSTSISSLESQHRADIMARMTKAQASKRIREAKAKVKKTYYEFNYPLTTAQNRKIIKVIEELDSLEAMFRKL